MAIQCSICLHRKRNQIDKALLLKEPLRSIAARFQVPHFSALYRHKPHVQARIKTAIKKREESAAAQLLADTEWLWGESQQYIEDARAAIKTLAVTEGSGKHAKTVYREYRDLSAMSGALRVAHENRRLFGDATGVIGQPAASVNFVLHVGSPHTVPGTVVDVAPQPPELPEPE